MKPSPTEGIFFFDHIHLSKYILSEKEGVIIVQLLSLTGLGLS